MDIKFKAMVETADDKYTKLVNMICKISNESGIDCDKILNLVSSIHNDEINLIVRLYEADKEKKNILNDDLQVFDFMIK